jgi:uncharacterized protein (TIGR03437 family)
MKIALAALLLLSATTLFVASGQSLETSTDSALSLGWSATNPLPSSRFAPGATILPSEKVLVVGGHSFIRNGFVTEAAIYDPATGTWSRTMSLPQAHRYTATLLPTGEVLVVGDDDFTATGPTAYRYNELTASWTATGLPGIKRYGPTVTPLPSGEVLMAGGYNGGCCSGPAGTYATAEVYNRNTDSWSSIAAMQTSRLGHRATLLASGKVLVTGGAIRDPVTPHRTAELYDPATRRWSPAGSMTTPRYSHTATLLPGGKVLVVGGFSAINVALASAEIYDPATDTWSPAAAPAVARGNHTATLLPSGKVLVAGGEHDNRRLGSAEIYNPADGTWSRAGAMLSERTQHIAVLLASGKVLVAGGIGADGADIASAELFDPSAAQPGSFVNVSAASFSAGTVARESIVAACGTNLSANTQAASVAPLPTTLAGTTVKVRDNFGIERLAPLFFVSPEQVNYQLPSGTALGPATVTITNGAGAVSLGAAQVVLVAPGQFAANANGQGIASAVALRVRANGSQSFEPVARFDASQNKFVAAPIELGPESDQLFLIFFCTGVRFRSNLSAVTVKIGGIDAQVLFAGAQGEFVGLDQINVRAPRNLAGRGEVEVALMIDGQAANAVKVNFR